MGVDSQEEVIHDHVFDSHHHHVIHTNLLVCALSTLTGMVALTTASEPAQQNRRFAFSNTPNTSKKSMIRRFSTKKSSKRRLLNGQTKSKHGKNPLWPFLNQRSHVSTQRVIAVLPQLQLKLKRVDESDDEMDEMYESDDQMDEMDESDGSDDKMDESDERDDPMDEMDESDEIDDQMDE